MIDLFRHGRRNVGSGRRTDRQHGTSLDTRPGVCRFGQRRRDFSNQKCGQARYDVPNLYIVTPAFSKLHGPNYDDAISR